MDKLFRLIKGETIRLYKYKILPVSLVTSVLWIVLFLFLTAEEARKMAPLVIFIDTAVMSVLLLGASHHLEKQDGTIRTMMVMPVSLGQIITAKTVASMFLAMESAVITSLAVFLIHRITFNYASLFLFIAISGAAHAAIGFVLSLNSRDFSSMLGLLAAYMFIFTVPSILFSFQIINARYEWLLMISPSHSANHLIASAVMEEYKPGLVITGCLYLVFLAAVLFKFAVFPKFRDNAVRG